VEGPHGEAKTQHGLRRAVRRGLWNVAIQAYLTAAVMNLKRLAALKTTPPTVAASIDRSVDQLLAILRYLRRIEWLGFARKEPEEQIMPPIDT